MTAPFFIQKGNVYALPVLHTNMELAALACKLFHDLKPACVAVELPENMTLQFMHGCSRLPDISVVSATSLKNENLYYLIEPCDALYETLRSALETNTPAFCIDLDADYPEVHENIPDPYAIQKIGLKTYYELYVNSKSYIKVAQDEPRELHMAKKLKELSLRYDSVLFIGGMNHVPQVMEALDRSSFPIYHSIERNYIELVTPSEDSLRHILGEWGWISVCYENAREAFLKDSSTLFPEDRQKLIYELYKSAITPYNQQGNSFPGYNLRNIMKFARNYALVSNRLLPDLFQILASAKGCVDHNYAYETWAIATAYPFHKNVDNLPVKDLSPDEIWGHSKIIRFHLKMKRRKGFASYEKRKDRSKQFNYPAGLFSICSYPPEDILVENFGHYLKKKGVQILREQAANTIPFSTSIEDGIDVRETIRHFAEKKLYVKCSGKPRGNVGSIVVIFDEDSSEENAFNEKYPWKATWLGEHTQESDMAFYATDPLNDVVGPGISRCKYGGFMMSYPPRRLMDIWHDEDYDIFRNKAEILLAAAIDYSIEPLIVYAASKPPRSQLKSFASRYGKKVVYVPLGQLSPIKIKQLCTFHVLDGQDRRKIAQDYIF